MPYSFDECYNEALKKLRHASFITFIDLDDKIKLGLYYIMQVYGIGFRSCVRGDWSWIELCLDDGPALFAQDLETMPMNQVLYDELRRNHNNGIMPEGFGQKPSPKKKWQEFGWLSPTGSFIESPWGSHLESAMEIIEKNGWTDEFDQWYEREDDFNLPENDFLCSVKGWVLIHNPSNDGDYIVTNIKPLTKKQREFLYSYFSDIGDTLRAEMYLREEE